jgi:hypothetical protein
VTSTDLFDQMIPKNAENGHFSKITYVSGGYSQPIKYKQLEGDERKGFGFGSKDASKTDEFTSTMRTEQYRSLIRRESDVLRKTTERNLQEITRVLDERLASTNSSIASHELSMRSPGSTSSLSPSRTGFNYSENVPQYDIGRTRVTPFDHKSKSDSFYKFEDSQGKRLGTHRPVSLDVGDGSWNITYKPPTHGGRSEVKNFFDKSHLSVGSP